MLKRFIEKNAAVICIILLTMFIFALGFICGKQTSAAQDVKIEPVAAVDDEPGKATFETVAEVAKSATAYTPQEMTVTATAYCPCSLCCGKCDGITATGTKATAGRTIAVDPSIIPYGTEVYIEGVGVRIAEDCGGAIKGNRIDIYFDTHEEALQFGHRTLTAKIAA